MDKTENIGLHLTPASEREMKFLQWRQMMNGDQDDSNMQKIDRAIGSLNERTPILQGGENPVNLLTEQDIDPTLTQEGKVADAAAVGKNISQLAEEIAADAKFYSYVEKTYEYTEKYIYSIGNNATIDLENPTYAGSDWVCVKVKCSKGDMVTVTGFGGGGSRAWAFVGLDGTVLARADADSHVKGLLLLAPQECYLVANAYVIHDYSVSVRHRTETIGTMEYLSDSLPLRMEATEPIAKDEQWSVGGYDTSGAVGSELAYNRLSVRNYRYMALPCYKGQRFVIEGRGGGSNRLWCFVDETSAIVANSGTYAVGADVLAPENGQIIIQVEINDDFPASVHFAPYTFSAVAETLKSVMDSRNSFNGALMFGDGISLKYETPEIPASPTHSGAERLSYFYGLYDALVTAYPEYVTKVDCDAECVAAGITRPDYMADYPIYMYKFIPAYTSNSNALDGVSDASRFKVYLVSGTHPEMMAIWDLYNTMRLICEQWKNDENLEALRWQCEFYVIPLSGPYGVAHASRTNHNGVDLNRNAPSTDWERTQVGTNTYSGSNPASEYETKVFAHYMQQIQPQVFIDHHNTYPSSDLGVLAYITSRKKSCVDVAASHISTMTRRWKKRFSNVLPDDNVIYGFATTTQEKGTRSNYGNDCGAWSYTFESQSGIGYDNGVVTEGAHSYDTVASTIATDGFINFLLIALRNASQRISMQLVD